MYLLQYADKRDKAILHGHMEQLGVGSIDKRAQRHLQMVALHVLYAWTTQPKGLIQLLSCIGIASRWIGQLSDILQQLLAEVVQVKFLALGFTWNLRSHVAHYANLGFLACVHSLNF